MLCILPTDKDFHNHWLHVASLCFWPVAEALTEIRWGWGGGGGWRWGWLHIYGGKRSLNALSHPALPDTCTQKQWYTLWQAQAHPADCVCAPDEGVTPVGPCSYHYISVETLQCSAWCALHSSNCRVDFTEDTVKHHLAAQSHVIFTSLEGNQSLIKYWHLMPQLHMCVVQHKLGRTESTMFRKVVGMKEWKRGTCSPVLKKNVLNCLLISHDEGFVILQTC